MGSFNETCALSNLPITYGTKVKILFLVRNPYVDCDQSFAKRGHENYANWFCRTPPISGEYDDCGDAKFKESDLTKLIASLFDKDIIPQPFGFNKYHTCPVLPGKGIHSYLTAAWQGRLIVRDGQNTPPPIPTTWPTWEKVHSLLKANKFKLQCDLKEGGYNAQPVAPGIVCVTYDTYSNERAKLQKITPLLEKEYDVELVHKWENRDGDPCLIVTAKGANKNPSKLVNKSVIRELLNTHPEGGSDDRKERGLPVLSVMVREDVWKLYHSTSDETIRTVDAIYKHLTNYVADWRASIKEENPSLHRLLYMSSRRTDVLPNIPFQTMVDTHIQAAAEDLKFKCIPELLRGSAELAKVEIVMGRTHQPWYIPPTGGQELHLDLKKQIHTGILSVVGKMDKEYHDE